MAISTHSEPDDFPSFPAQEALWPYLLVAAVLFGWGLFLILTPGASAPQLRHTPPRMGQALPGAALASPGQVVRTLRVGFLPGATFEATMTELAANLEARTGGRIRLEPLPGYAQDGRKLGEVELVDLVSQGRLEMALCTTSPLSNFNSRFEALDLPFLIQTYSQADRLLDGPVGRKLLTGLESHHLKGLGYLEIGFRIFSTTVPMPGLSDFQGKRLRVMESRSCLRMATAIGAEGVACPPDRVYAMSRDGRIEGADRTLPSFWASKLYEVQPYITETRHMYSAKVLVINQLAYDSLTPEDQAILEQVMAETERAHRQRQRQEESEVRLRCRKRGITLYTLTPDERAKFRGLCQPLYDEFDQPELLEEIRKTIL